MTQNSTILLISNKPGRLESLSLMLRQIGYNILSASDGREGFRLIQRESPNLVISEMNLPVISALKLCRMIRADRELWTTPLIFVGESSLESKNIIEILDAGADECLADFSNLQYLAIKTEWLIKLKYSKDHLIQNYNIIRNRQLSITQIIKDTATLFTQSDSEYKTVSLDDSSSREFRKNTDQKTYFGMNMISALANLLEEQMNALETWGRFRRGEEFFIDQKQGSEILASNYESITYDLIDEKLPAH